jgi:LPS sulfotransferase NodH
LTNTNVAGVPNSYVHKPSLTNWMEVHGIAPNSLDNRSETWGAVLKKAHTTGPAETGIFGLKLQGGSLNYFMDQLKLLHPEPNSDVGRLNTTFGEAAFIFSVAQKQTGISRFMRKTNAERALAYGRKWKMG